MPDFTRASIRQDPPTVIVTGVGSTTGMSVIKALRVPEAMPVRIVGTDTHTSREIAGSWFCDAFEQVPRADDAGYADALLALCRRERPTLVIPIVDPELEVVAAAAAAFRELGAMVVVGDVEMVRACNDKRATRELLAAACVPVPRWWPAESLDPASLSYPVFVKPRRGVSSRGARRVEGGADLAALLETHCDLEIEELLEGVEYTIDVLADLDGRLMAVVPRVRLEVRNGISYRGRTVDDADLIAAACRVVDALGLRGPANLQCMVQDGRATFFEVNPRFSGSLPLTVAAGVNGPLWLLRLALGEPAPDGLLPFQTDIVMTRYWAEVFHPPEGV